MNGWGLFVMGFVLGVVLMAFVAVVGISVLMDHAYGRLFTPPR